MAPSLRRYVTASITSALRLCFHSMTLDTLIQHLGGGLQVLHYQHGTNWRGAFSSQGVNSCILYSIVNTTQALM